MKLTKLIKESFNENMDTLKDEESLNSFADWDSMAHMFFITRLEEEYSIELTGYEIAGMQTIGDIKKVITSKGKDL